MLVNGSMRQFVHELADRGAGFVESLRSHAQDVTERMGARRAMSPAGVESDAAKGADLISNGMPDNPGWMQEATGYQVYLRSFMDSNGDGVGDLPGVISKLDYLQSMGVDMIHLNPFMPSGGKDGGYDIVNYLEVAKEFGTTDDAKRLFEEAHKRGMRVMVETVANHTSIQHPWFQEEKAMLEETFAKGGREALDKLDKNSLKYVWDFAETPGTPKGYEDIRVIFNDLEESNWAEVPFGRYFHRFFTEQPDLNFNNPAVRQEIEDASKFWFEAGADAQRLDAVPYLYETAGFAGENAPETHAFLRELQEKTDAVFSGSRKFVAEANMVEDEMRPYLDDIDGIYHFSDMPRRYLSLWEGNKKHLQETLELTKHDPPGTTRITFNRNHDELTLEKVSTAEREMMQQGFRDGMPHLGIPPTPDAPINLGLRVRMTDALGNDPQRIKQMNSMLFTFPGTPMIYNGDEIGMRTIHGLPDRDGVRGAMQWTDGANGGFSEAAAADLTLPSAMNDARIGSDGVNVAAQLADPDSTLNHIKHLSAMRKANPALMRGSASEVATDSDHVFGMLREADGEQVLRIDNLRWDSQAARLDAERFKDFDVEVLDSNNPSRAWNGVPTSIDLGPNEYAVLKLVPKRAA